MNIAVIGLGKLGLPLATLHSENHKVYGIDLNVEAVNQISRGECPVWEPGLEQRMQSAVRGQRLEVTTDFAVVRKCDFILIIVPSPSDASGAFSSAYVLDAIHKIGAQIANPTGPAKTIVVCSTVMPGECTGPIRNALEVSSGLKVGWDIGLVYSPEFIALGSVINDMRNPDMLLIGESDLLSGLMYEQLCRTLIGEKVPAYHMSLTSAEVAKIAVNSYVTMKISFANALGELCELLPEANADEVTEAIGSDSRIGHKYLKPGGPFGGPCFPRDNRAFALAGARKGLLMPIATATDQINERQIQRTKAIIDGIGRQKVGILGASYKPGTRVTEESFGTKLADELISAGYQVEIWDPAPIRAVDVPEGVKITTATTACFGNDVTTVVATPHRQIPGLFPEILSVTERHHSVIIDPWNCIPEGPWDDTHVYRMNRGDHAA